MGKCTLHSSTNDFSMMLVQLEQATSASLEASAGNSVNTSLIIHFPFVVQVNLHPSDQFSGYPCVLSTVCSPSLSLTWLPFKIGEINSPSVHSCWCTCFQPCGFKPQHLQALCQTNGWWFPCPVQTIVLMSESLSSMPKQRKHINTELSSTIRQSWKRQCEIQCRCKPEHIHDK